MLNENQEIEQLKNELSDAKAMALDIMRSSAETGQVLQFLKQCFATDSFSGLAHHLLEFLSNIDLKSCLLIHGVEGELFFTLDADQEMIDRSFLEKHQYSSRICYKNERLVVNFSHCSLLINNFPDDEVKAGKLRDTLAILMDGVNEKVNSIILANRAQEARNVKDAFFTLMSHELRTPLNPIIGYSTRLLRKLEGFLDDKDKRAFETIKKNGEHLLRLINDILSLSDVSNNQIVLHRQNTCIVGAVCDAEQALLNLQTSHNVTVNIVRPEEDYISYVDSERIRDVFIGVLSNAIKYSPDGTVNILFSESKEGLLSFVNISFIDTGKGIASDDHEKVFHHFSTRDDPTSQKMRSEGISLFLVRELVRLSGGRIELESEIGSGSTFRVCLPLIDSDYYFEEGSSLH